MSNKTAKTPPTAKRAARAPKLAAPAKPASSPPSAAKGAAAMRQQKSSAVLRKRTRPLTLPAASVAKAKNAFQNFSLSRFGKTQPPPHYVVHPKKATPDERRQHTVAHQREMIARKLDALKAAAKNQSTPPPNNGMKISLPKATVAKLLPSYEAKAGTVNLDDLLNLLEQKRTGSEFYSNGNPTLRSISVQSKVQQIINGIKGGGK